MRALLNILFTVFFASLIVSCGNHPTPQEISGGERNALTQAVSPPGPIFIAEPRTATNLMLAKCKKPKRMAYSDNTCNVDAYLSVGLKKSSIHGAWKSVRNGLTEIVCRAECEADLSALNLSTPLTWWGGAAALDFDKNSLPAGYCSQVGNGLSDAQRGTVLGALAGSGYSAVLMEDSHFINGVIGENADQTLLDTLCEQNSTAKLADACGAASLKLSTPIHVSGNACLGAQPIGTPVPTPSPSVSVKGR